MQTELFYPVTEREHAKSEVRATVLRVPDHLDSLEAQLDAAEAVPGVKEEIEQRLKSILNNLIQGFQSNKITPDVFVSKVKRAPHSARMIECKAAINSGRIPGVEVVGHSGGQNLILRNFYEDLFARFMDGNGAGANQTLQIKYLALGLSYAATSFTQADLTSEFFRKAIDPDDTFDDGLSTFYASMYLKKSEANPTGVTTVASATSTQITATSATGFVNQGRYQVETDNNTYTFTGALSGSVLTCTAITGGSLTNASAFPDDDVPQAGDNLMILISEGGMIIGNDASDTLNSGKPMNRKRLEIAKNPSLSLSLDYIYTATSIDT